MLDEDEVDCFLTYFVPEEMDLLMIICGSDETNNNFRPNTNTNNIRFSKSTEYEYE